MVAFHTGWTHTALGQAGVDVFFVISGFIMAHVSRRETTPGAFLLARVTRVVPLYWVVTLVAVVLHRVTDAGHILESLAFWPHPDQEGRDWPVLLQGWTLCYEMFFYALFAAALLIVPSRRLPALTVVLLALAVAGAVLHPANAAVATYTSPLLLEFLAGLWLHRIWDHGWLRQAWPALGVGLAAFATQTALPEPGTWRCLAWGVPAALVVAGALGLEEAGRVPFLPWLRRLGDASYATYLTHTLVQDTAVPLLRPLPLPVASPLAVFACMAVGWATYMLVEQPLSRWLRPGIAVAARAVRPA